MLIGYATICMIDSMRNVEWQAVYSLGTETLDYPRLIAGKYVVLRDRTAKFVHDPRSGQMSSYSPFMPAARRNANRTL